MRELELFEVSGNPLLWPPPAVAVRGPEAILRYCSCWCSCFLLFGCDEERGREKKEEQSEGESELRKEEGQSGEEEEKTRESKGQSENKGEEEYSQRRRLLLRRESVDVADFRLQQQKGSLYLQSFQFSEFLPEEHDPYGIALSETEEEEPRTTTEEKNAKKREQEEDGEEGEEEEKKRERSLFESVSSLSLKDNHLRALSSSFSRYLLSISSLDLSQNGFDHIPPVLASLRSLSELSMRRNLVQNLASCLRKMTALKVRKAKQRRIVNGKTT